uniref:AlNc14C422G11538 protein n=1 Tax=Albugo laibachii Nc14 TaxID=890382 RepID=F0WZD6_9STRA|nr:AlNc14C422G11538 [Albugo laibachii Nc14]|eukprot:CCA26856.1 AlNc14C422G11538 [Albugo laibachii Nc14]
MNVKINIKIEAAIATNFSYELRDGGHVVHYKFDRVGTVAVVVLDCGLSGSLSYY